MDGKSSCLWELWKEVVFSVYGLERYKYCIFIVKEECGGRKECGYWLVVLVLLCFGMVFENFKYEFCFFRMIEDIIVC